MPNGKTHFMTGAFVGATVNFLMQSAKMAMDYDRPTDRDEFFLCASAGAFAANLEGIASFSPGLPRGAGSYPGINSSSVHNPESAASSARNSIVHGKENSAVASETAELPNPRQLFHAILSASLIAYAISSDHTRKLSRATRLFLWVFGISYLSHIACDSAA